MPRPGLRTHSYRRIYRRTPGGRTVIHYEPKRPKAARCAICGGILNGVPRTKPVELKNMPKTYKRPERPYGGYLCHRCLARLLKESIRASP